MPPELLKQRIADKDALVCVATDDINQSLIDAGATLKVVANIAVGYNNIDVALRPVAWRRRHEHA